MLFLSCVRYGHHGTGFVTYDSVWGAVVHTSKHVVMDPYEAMHTDVIFFCDRDEEGVIVSLLFFFFFFFSSLFSFLSVCLCLCLCLSLSLSLKRCLGEGVSQ